MSETTAENIQGRGGRMQVTWFRRLGEIEALKGDWEALEEKATNRTAFSTFDWIMAWYTHYGGVIGEPLVGAVRSDGVLVAIAPFVYWKGTLGGVPVRRVDFAGHNSEAGEFLIADGHTEAVKALLESLKREVRFDLVCLNNIDEGSEVSKALEKTAAAGGLRMELAVKRYASVELRDGFDAYFSKMTSKFRRNIRSREKRMDAAGGWKIDRISPGSTDGDTAEFMSRVFGITDASKKAINNGGPMASHHKRFYEDVAARFAKKGALDISVLSINNTDAAAIFALADRGVFYDCMISYKEAYHEYSPGTVLMIEILKTLPKLDIRYVVSHGDHEYKRYWTSGFVCQNRVFMFEPSIRGVASRLAKFSVIPGVQRLKAAISSKGDGNAEPGESQE